MAFRFPKKMELFFISLAVGTFIAMFLVFGQLKDMPPNRKPEPSGINSAEGIEVITKEEKFGEKSFSVSFVRIDTDKAEVRIVSPVSISESGGADIAQYTGLTLREYADIGKYRLVHSAGFLSSWTPSYALGYVKIAGKEYNRAHRTWLTSGVFCTNGDDFEIKPFKNTEQFFKWQDCIQAGPMMVEKGEMVLDVPKNWKSFMTEEKEQSFLCSGTDKKLLMGITSPVALKDLADFLAADDSQMGCSEAVLLSPKYTAGMTIRIGKDKKDFGATEIPLPNAIAVK